MSQSHTPRRVLRYMLAGLRPMVRSFRSNKQFRGRIEYGTAALHPSTADLVIGIIDDPELSMRLVSVRGRISPTTIDALANALEELPRDAVVHLDMTDAVFTHT